MNNSSEKPRLYWMNNGLLYCSFSFRPRMYYIVRRVFRWGMFWSVAALLLVYLSHSYPTHFQCIFSGTERPTQAENVCQEKSLLSFVVHKEEVSEERQVFCADFCILCLGWSIFVFWKIPHLRKKYFEEVYFLLTISFVWTAEKIVSEFSWNLQQPFWNH